MSYLLPVGGLGADVKAHISSYLGEGLVTLYEEFSCLFFYTTFVRDFGISPVPRSGVQQLAMPEENKAQGVRRGVIVGNDLRFSAMIEPITKTSKIIDDQESPGYTKTWYLGWSKAYRRTAEHLQELYETEQKKWRSSAPYRPCFVWFFESAAEKKARTPLALMLIRYEAPNMYLEPNQGHNIAHHKCRVRALFYLSHAGGQTTYAATTEQGLRQ
ncbi:unnamed protein product [Amoebophrya sp. A25]|nr:unnamed protein product [Amoebophrya sp. A25]|eukprot:GSA25T00026118001.1